MTVTPGYGVQPGMGALATTAPERHVWWGKDERNLYSVNSYIDSSVTDAGSTPTTNIRAGNLFAKQTASGNLYLWDPTTDDGRDVLHSVLYRDQSMLDVDGTAVVKYGHFIAAGGVQIDQLFIKGAAFAGHLHEYLARRQLQLGGRYLLSDDLASSGSALGMHMAERAKTADYTIVKGDNGLMFTNTGAGGAVIFTLPALMSGLAFKFKVVADQNLKVVSAPADKIITFNDAAADSVSFETGSQKIGGTFLVYTNDAGTFWHVDVLSDGNTVTVAT